MDPIVESLILILTAAGIPLIINTIWKNQNIKMSIDDNQSMYSSDENAENVDIPLIKKEKSNKNIIEIIKMIIEQKRFILIQSNINNKLFEFIIKNYENEPLKREPTYIKITGDSSTSDLEFSSWSDTFTVGQHVHNNSVLNSFISELEVTIANKGVNPIDEIKKQIGASAYYRWKQLAQKMLRESEKSEEQVINELVSYGLSKDLAVKIIELQNK
jgi:hypothetical protein